MGCPEATIETTRMKSARLGLATTWPRPVRQTLRGQLEFALAWAPRGSSVAAGHAPRTRPWKTTTLGFAPAICQAISAGSCASHTARSADFPASRVPTSWRPRALAAFAVALLRDPARWRATSAAAAADARARFSRDDIVARYEALYLRSQS